MEHGIEITIKDMQTGEVCVYKTYDGFMDVIRSLDRNSVDRFDLITGSNGLDIVAMINSLLLKILIDMHNKPEKENKKNN